MPRYLLVAILLAITPCIAWGSGGGRKPLLLSVHLETDPAEGPKFSFPLPMPGTGEKRAFKKSPEITDNQVSWFYLFPAESGNGSGAAFKLDSVGTNRLEFISTSNQGRHLLTIVHPSTSSFVRIDKVISDGIIVVWEGLTPEHITGLREHLQERRSASGPAEPTANKDPADTSPNVNPNVNPNVDASEEPEAPAAPSPEKKKRFKFFRK
jgi:hypothetical protein